MTKFCAITTRKNLELMDDNDIHFILTRQLEMPEFQEYLKKTDKPWILDCDSFEIMQEKGKYEPTDFTHTLELAKEFKPTYMILPDYICDYKKTYEAAEQYIEQVKAIGVKPIGAIQAVNAGQIYVLLEKYWHLGVRCFAIPLGAPEYEDPSMRTTRIGRYNIFKKVLSHLETPDDRMEYLHFLGMTQNTNELFLTPKEVNSLDSGKPIQAGRNMIPITSSAYIPNMIHVEGELDEELTQEQKELAEENIRYTRWVLNSERIDIDDYRDYVVNDLAPWKNEHRLEAALLGLVEEVGEFSSPINKALRKTGKAETASYEKLRGELSDIAFYFNMALNVLDISYEELINYNYAKLSERYKEGFSNQAAEAQIDKKIVKE